MKKLASIVFFGILFLSIAKSYGQWQPDFRLTNNPANSYTPFNNAWCIAASGADVHVVWWDNRDGNDEIYYKRSTDSGLSWGADTRLTSNSGSSQYPSISVSGLNVHVVWQDDRDGNFEIYYNRSTDGGLTWSSDTRLTNASGASQYPSISISGSNVHVVWQDGRDGDDEIYYVRSTDSGLSWGADKQLTNNTLASRYPSVSVSGLVVHVTWHDSVQAIYYERSTDGGVNWGQTVLIAENSGIPHYPCIATSGSNVHIVWQDNRVGPSWLYYRRSTDSGLSWEAELQLMNSSQGAFYPSVSVFDSNVHVVWQESRDGNWEIYYKRSTDGGVNWETYIRLTDNTSASKFPSLSVSGSNVHVVWQEYRDGNWEIYSKRNPTGNPTGIEIISSEVPEDFKLGQNYPNPFNPSTIITYDLPASGHVTLSVYDVLGNEVQKLVNESQAAGRYRVEFTATGLASGVYLYQITAGSFVQTRKLLLLR